MLCPVVACAAVTSRLQLVLTSFWGSRKENDRKELPGVEPEEARKRLKSLIVKFSGTLRGQSQHPKVVREDGKERAREGRRVARRNRASMFGGFGWGGWVVE